jgi:uncharacterized protein YndB with AHSA1/START domain
MKPFEVSRVFDAPRDKVWKAWTEADRLKQWWGPKGFVVTHLKIDLRSGGTMHYCLKAPDGSEMWGRFAYREVAKPERLVFINSFSDAKGGVARHSGHMSWPLDMVSTITFEALGDKTRVTVHWVPAEGSTELERKTFDEGRESMKQGWGGTMEQLTDYLKKG